MNTNVKTTVKVILAFAGPVLGLIGNLITGYVEGKRDEAKISAMVQKEVSKALSQR